MLMTALTGVIQAALSTAKRKRVAAYFMRLRQEFRACGMKTAHRLPIFHIVKNMLAFNAPPRPIPIMVRDHARHGRVHQSFIQLKR